MLNQCSLYYIVVAIAECLGDTRDPAELGLANASLQLVNLQEKNGKAKPYQVREFLSLVEQYDLKLGD